MAERWIRRILLVCGALFGVFVLSGCLPAPRVLVVTSTADAVDGEPGDGVCATADGTCTLRAAVMEANASDELTVVVLEPQTYHLTLARSEEDDGLTGDLDVHQSVQIRGHGAVVDGGDLDRVFDLHDGSVSLSQLTVQHGQVIGDGGGIRNNAVGLGLVEAAVVDNAASGAGGGLFNLTSAGVVNVSMFGNTAGVNLGGAAANGPNGQLVVAAATITGNRAGDRGGALASVSATSANRVQILHSVIADNGVLADGTPSDCALSGGPGMTSTIESFDFNLDAGASCGFVAASDEHGDPMLGPVVVDDGVPAYRRPTSTSPLLDAIPAGTDRCPPGRDQRGVPRPQGPGCEIGAIEVTGDELVISIAGAPAAAPSNGGPVTLSASPAGGVFSGPGVVGNTFRPTTAGVGMRTVTYTYAGASASRTTEVFRVSLSYEAIAMIPPPTRTVFVFSGSPSGGSYSVPSGPLSGNRIIVTGCGPARFTATYAGSYRGVHYTTSVLIQPPRCPKPS